MATRLRFGGKDMVMVEEVVVREREGCELQEKKMQRASESLETSGQPSWRSDEGECMRIVVRR